MMTEPEKAGVKVTFGCHITQLNGGGCLVQGGADAVRPYYNLFRASKEEISEAKAPALLLEETCPEAKPLPVLILVNCAVRTGPVRVQLAPGASAEGSRVYWFP